MKVIALFKGALKKPADEIKKDVLEFFKGRLQNQLISQGYAYDTVDAVLAAGINDVVLAHGKNQSTAGFPAKSRI